MEQLSVFDFMEDFDNTELNPYERQEQLEEAVRDYNEAYNTKHDPNKMFVKYEIRRHLTEE